MTKVDSRIRAMMERVLEETCRQLPHGGSHEARRFVVLRLTAQINERTTFGQLGIVARKALADLEAGYHASPTADGLLQAM